MDAVAIEPTNPPVQPQEMSLLFDGENEDFRHLVTKGALLELVTFGFYRFWLATAMRRHLWSHTRLDGDAFEYTGSARELFIGFLFALAILVPAYFAFFLLGISLESFKAFASVPQTILFFIFGQFAIYRARRYRLTRTLWRGVRLWMTGSGLSYAMRAVAWDLLTIVTLGLALPWRVAALERYKMNNTHYGSLRCSFVGTGGQFFKAGIVMWLCSILLLLGFFAPLIAQIIQNTTKTSAPIVQPSLTLFSILATVVAPAVYGYFKAIEWRWWIQGVRVGDMRANCALTKGDITKNTYKAMGLYMLISIVMTFILSIGASAFSRHAMPAGASQTQLGAGFSVAAIIGLLYYLIMLSLYGIVTRIYFQQRIWKMVINSITLVGTDALSHVDAKGDAVSALGEGFADSLDIVGF